MQGVMKIIIGIFVVLLVVSGGIYYFASSSEPENDISLELDTLIEFPVNNSNDNIRSNIKDINAFLKERGMPPQEFYKLLDEESEIAINKIAKDLDISKEQAAELFAYLIQASSFYNNIPLVDGLEMVTYDLLDYDNKILQDIKIPLSYLDNPLIPQNMNVYVPEYNYNIDIIRDSISEVFGKNHPLSKSDNLNEIMEEVVLKEDLTDFEGEAVTACGLGVEKTIMLEENNLIDDGLIDMITDRIVYGPDGKIVK